MLTSTTTLDELAAAPAPRTDWRRAWRRGMRSGDLVTARYEELLRLPLGEVRSLLRIPSVHETPPGGILVAPAA